MINPIQMIQGIKNPQQFVQNMMNNSQAMQNPMMKNAMEMYQKGDTEGLSQLVDNVAREKGTSLEEMRKQLGF